MMTSGRLRWPHQLRSKQLCTQLTVPAGPRVLQPSLCCGLQLMLQKQMGKTEASELKNQVTLFLKAASDLPFLLCTWAMSHCGLVENIPDLDLEHVGLSVVSISDNLTLIRPLSRALTPHSGDRHGFLSAYFTEMLNQGRKEVKSFINDKDFLQIQILFYIFI